MKYKNHWRQCKTKLKLLIDLQTGIPLVVQLGEHNIFDITNTVKVHFLTDFDRDNGHILIVCSKQT